MPLLIRLRDARRERKAAEDAYALIPSVFVRDDTRIPGEEKRVAAERNWAAHIVLIRLRQEIDAYAEEL